MIIDTVEYITESAYQLAIDAINVIDTINDMTLPTVPPTMKKLLSILR